MPSQAENTAVVKTQRTYARLAGFLSIGVIVLAIGGGMITSRVAGDGPFAEVAGRIAASEHMYRFGLSLVVIVSISSALLAFALYATLKPVNSLLAQLAMIFNLGDAFVAIVVRMCSFVRLHLYLTRQSASGGGIAAESLSDLMRRIADTTENIGGILFGLGSLIFFYLFFKSHYIPRALSALGVCASGIWICLYFAGLIFPEHRGLFQSICFPPMGLAEVLTGFYLALFTVKIEGHDKPAARSV